MVGASPPTCPYLDKDCPKVSEVDDDIKDVRKALTEVTRILYIIAGIILIQTGVGFL